MAGSLMLLVAQVVGQLGIHRPFHQCLGQLLKQSMLADQVLRTLVIAKQLVDQFFVDSHMLLQYRGTNALHKIQNTLGFGTAFGAALFTGADLVAVPALNLSQSSGDEPVASLATPFAAHLVYGAATETVRKLVR